MERVIARALAAFAIVGFVAGCSSDVVAPEGYELVQRSQASGTSAEQFMLDAGCIRTSGAPDSGSVSFIGRSGQPIIFDCTGRDSQTVAIAVQNYLTASSAGVLAGAMVEAM